MQIFLLLHACMRDAKSYQLVARDVSCGIGWVGGLERFMMDASLERLDARALGKLSNIDCHLLHLFVSDVFVALQE